MRRDCRTGASTDLASGSLSTQSVLSNAAGPIRNAALMVGSLQVDRWQRRQYEEDLC